jgi:hypothetical protein
MTYHTRHSTTSFSRSRAAGSRSFFSRSSKV